MKNKIDSISLTLPLKEKYISLLRLMVSAIGVRKEIVYDDIEDIKLAVDEAFLFAINNKNISTDDENRIEFNIEISEQSIKITVPFKTIDEKKKIKESIGMILIKEIMNEFNIIDNNNESKIEMVKLLSKKE